MTRRYAAQIQKASESGKYVFLSAKQRAALDRLKAAYRMNRRMDVLAYLIEQGLAGLPEEQGEGAA